MTAELRPQELQEQALPTAVDLLPVDIDREIQKAKRGRDALDRLFNELLVPGVDYDRVPGTDKHTLLKPGAELLCQVFHLAPGKPEILTKQEDFQNGVFSYVVGVPIYHRETGILVAYGIGAANSMEPKYRYRRAKDDPSLRIENPDPAGEQNTLVKMGAKRAFIDGVIKATGASRKFSQDMEDYLLPEKASTKQVNYIRSLFRGKKDEEIFNEIADLLGHEVATWDDVTREEASQIIEAKKSANGSNRKQTIPDAPRPRNENGGNGGAEINWNSFWASTRSLGYSKEEVHAVASEIFGIEVTSLKDVIQDQQSLNLLLSELARRKKDAS